MRCRRPDVSRTGCQRDTPWSQDPNPPTVAVGGPGGTGWSRSHSGKGKPVRSVMGRTLGCWLQGRQRHGFRVNLHARGAGLSTGAGAGVQLTFTAESVPARSSRPWPPPGNPRWPFCAQRTLPPLTPKTSPTLLSCPCHVPACTVFMGLAFLPFMSLSLFLGKIRLTFEELKPSQISHVVVPSSGCPINTYKKRWWVTQTRREGGRADSPSGSLHSH